LLACLSNNINLFKNSLASSARASILQSRLLGGLTEDKFALYEETSTRPRQILLSGAEKDVGPESDNLHKVYDFFYKISNINALICCQNPLHNC